MYWLIKKVMRVAMVMTKTTAAPMPTDEEILLETPRNGQIPNVCAKTMLLTKIALIISSIYSMMINFKG